MKRFHIYVILFLVLSSTVLAQHNGKTAVTREEADTVADSATVAQQLRSSRRIDSIRAVMSERRKHKNPALRPSLRATFDTVADTTVIELPDDTLSAAIDTIKDGLGTTDSVKIAESGSIRQKSDTIASVSDSIVAAVDSVVAPRDSAAIDTVPRSKIVRSMVDLDNFVDFSAKDSLVMFGQNKAFMYGDSKVVYGEIDLAADELQMDMRESTVYAVGRPDTTGEIIGSPVFKDKSGEYESKTMRYNFKTERGYITDVVTQQGEGYLTGGKTKKMEDNTYFMENGRYTTCDDHEHPHFYMQLTKAKVVPKKNVVSGPAYMVLCDVPLPLAVPFGYFPFSSKYSSGIIMPTFGDDYQRGFYLSDGGYYFAINDYVDLALTGEIYTKGSWGLAARSSYRKRYKFSGNFDMSYLTTINGEKGDPDYSKQKNFRISWTHTQDNKANPNMTFSASVNFATSGYSRNDVNSYYNSSFTENTKNSTVNLSYRFSSKFQMSTTASLTQRSQDSTLSVSFPNFTFSLSQVAPFKRKRMVGSERWYEKIKLSYTGSFQNNLTAKQNVFFKKSLIKDWSNGMRHSVPISATFSLFDYINVSPSLQMQDRMYTRKVRRSWDQGEMKEVMDTTYGFYNIFDFSAAVTLDTKIYGFFQPLKFMGDKVKMIRHVMSPSISFSASPDFSSPFWGYWGNYCGSGEDRAGEHVDFQQRGNESEERPGQHWHEKNISD